MDTLKTKMDVRLDDFKTALNNRLQIYSDSNFQVNFAQADTSLSADIMEGMSKKEKIGLYTTAINIARSSRTFSQSIHDELEMRQKRINLHEIEWHKKFSLSFACIVLFFVGAPLGAIIRKGGLGMPVVFAILIFILYHIMNMSGMKLVKEGELPAYIGMWISTAALVPFGIFLTYKSTTDSVLLDSTFYNSITNGIRTKMNQILRFLKLKKSNQE
jgi:lipopolysaccharide export system permease protein